MKKIIFIFLFVFLNIYTFAQIPRIAVSTFNATGGISSDEAQIVTELFIAELVSTGRVSVVDRSSFDLILAEMKFQESDWVSRDRTAQLGQAIGAEAIIRGQLMKMGDNIYWTATMVDVNTAQILSSARDQIGNINQIFNRLPDFCQQIISNLPQPPAPPVNNFIGRWQSSSRNGICILEFRADGSIFVENYSVYYTYSRQLLNEGAQNITSRGYGIGTYSFDINNVNIRLTIQGISAYSGSNRYIGLYRFNEGNNSFILLVEGGLDNGLISSFHITENGNDLYYFQTFTKIR